MKKSILSLLAFLLCFAVNAQEKPDWVKQRPIDQLSFTGIGMAKKSDKDYVQKAKQNALSELVSEIKVEVSVNSLLNTMEDGDNVKQAFAESIRTNAKAEIERFRMVDTWQDADEYWVYYELNRFDYEEYMEARRQKAIQSGFDFWYKGQASLQQGDLTAAIEMFSKGLEAVAPAMNQDLTCTYEGQTINLGTEIYASLTGVFNGIAVVVNPTTVGGVPFKGIADPVAVGVYKDGNPLRNVRLNAEFVSGSGDLSTLAPTDENGVAALYVRNITSKQAQQEVRVSIAADAFKEFRNGVNASLFKKMLSTLPSAALTVNLEQAQISAYIKKGQCDIESLERSIKSVLTNNFFNVVSSPSEADVIVKLDNKFKVGRKVPGELYDFMECFSSIGIQVLNNRSNAVLMNYSVNDLRSLVPANKSVAQAQGMAARELMKRVQRELNKELKKVTIDTTGDIPDRPDEEPVVEATPVPTLPETPAEPAPAPRPIVIVVPQVVPAPKPEPKPEPETKPAPKPKPSPSKRAIRGELETNVFVEFDRITNIGDKSRVFFKVINRTNDDFELYFNLSNVNVINEKGEKVKKIKMKVGSDVSDWYIRTLIVPDVPTEMMFEVSQLESIALFSLEDNNRRIVKLRNLN